MTSPETLPDDIAARAIELIRTCGLDAWVYRGNDWLITKADAPHVAREAWTVKFEPTVVSSFEDKLDAVLKVVGVSDDLDRVKRAEAAAQQALAADPAIRRDRLGIVAALNTGAVVATRRFFEGVVKSGQRFGKGTIA